MHLNVASIHLFQIECAEAQSLKNRSGLYCYYTTNYGDYNFVLKEKIVFMDLNIYCVSICKPHICYDVLQCCCLVLKRIHPLASLFVSRMSIFGRTCLSFRPWKWGQFCKVRTFSHWDGPQRAVCVYWGIHTSMEQQRTASSLMSVDSNS